MTLYLANVTSYLTRCLFLIYNCLFYFLLWGGNKLRYNFLKENHKRAIWNTLCSVFQVRESVQTHTVLIGCGFIFLLSAQTEFFLLSKLVAGILPHHVCFRTVFLKTVALKQYNSVKILALIQSTENLWSFQYKTMLWKQELDLHTNEEKLLQPPKSLIYLVFSLHCFQFWKNVITVCVCWILTILSFILSVSPVSACYPPFNLVLEDRHSSTGGRLIKLHHCCAGIRLHTLDRGGRRHI